MSKTNKLLLSVLVIVVLFLGISAAKKIKQPPKVKSADNVNQSKSENNSSSQENEGGNVTVIVKSKILKVGENPVFELEFETHSVDLDFDVSKQSYLVDDKGNSLTDGIWNGSPAGGHHREGTLTFDTVLSETKFVELIIENVAGVAERKLKWNL